MYELFGCRTIKSITDTMKQVSITPMHLHLLDKYVNPLLSLQNSSVKTINFHHLELCPTI